jgi:hypothetical protein
VAGQCRAGEERPGSPKTDTLDAVWLAKLAERSLLSPSLVPAEPMRQVRDLVLCTGGSPTTTPDRPGCCRANSTSPPHALARSPTCSTPRFSRREVGQVNG